MRLCIIFLLSCSFFFGFTQKEYHLHDIEKSANKIEFLNLSNELLVDIPFSVRSCKKIKKLWIKNNQITFLPAWLTELKNLEEININGNRRLNIKQAFSIISTFPNLKKISANHCNMLYLPVSIRRLPELVEVEISDNHIKYLPPIFEYLHLKKFDISHNCIDTLPSSIVFMNSLTHLDLSYNPAGENKYNYYSLALLKNLRSLNLSGIKRIPSEIDKLFFLKEITLINSSIKSLPESFKALNQLTKIDLRACKNLKLSEFIESIKGAKKTIKELKIGHQDLNTIPYNISKLKNIQTLIIDNACFEKLSSSFSKFRGNALHFRNCRFSNPSSIFNHVGKAKKLKSLYINNCVFGQSNWKIGSSKYLEQIFINDCGITYIPIQPKSFPKLKLLNLVGNKIPKNKITWEKPKTVIGLTYNTILYAEKERENWRYIQPNSNVKRMIYTEIGDIFTLPSGTKIEIKPEAFIKTGNLTVKNDVRLEIKEIIKPADFAKTKYPTFLPTNQVADVKYAIELHAYQDSVEVYIKSEKPIIIEPQFEKRYTLNKYYFHNYKQKWERLNHKNDICPNTQPTIVESECGYYPDIPRMDYKLKVSKVFIKLQRRKKKNKLRLNFEITPEYGYREQLLNPFGDKIKGYPELKNYKGIKWRYVGDSIERDLKKLYFLSDEAKAEKLKKYSTLKGYVLDIKDIRVFPNPNEDNYLIQFIQGRDTFSVQALPFLSVYKAHKIQRWHKVKYRKYKKALLRRKDKWLKMDTTYLNRYEDFEVKLETYRLLKLNANYKIVQSQTEVNNNQQLTIFKTGLYQLAIPLLINNGALKKPIFYIHGKRFHPQKVLISNLTKNYSFWSSPKQIPKEKGIYTISTLINDQLYSGSWGISNKVTFEKVKND